MYSYVCYVYVHIYTYNMYEHEEELDGTGLRRAGEARAQPAEAMNSSREILWFSGFSFGFRA